MTPENEARTRQEIIDKRLAKAGWNVSNPDHHGYEEKKTWLGRFNPAEFDLKYVNCSLKDFAKDPDAERGVRVYLVLKTDRASKPGANVSCRPDGADITYCRKSSQRQRKNNRSCDDALEE